MHRLLLAAALLGTGALTACDVSDGEGPALTGEITVVADTWNGWDPDHRSTPDTRTISAREGESTTFRCLGDTLEVRVTEVGESSVTLTTSTELAPRTESGGSDHLDLTDRFEVEDGASVGFSTPTLDAGCSYTVELESA